MFGRLLASGFRFRGFPYVGSGVLKCRARYVDFVQMGGFFFRKTKKKHIRRFLSLVSGVEKIETGMIIRSTC
jgi:hypothetical protein